jgi:hypothetical protein
MNKIKLKFTRLLPAVLLAVSLSYCSDIGEWEILKSESSRNNINAYQPIYFMSKTYPLIFGTSTTSGNNFIIGQGSSGTDNKPLPEDTLEIGSINGSGKIAGSEDGIAFYFREVDASKNFIMEADFYIISFGSSNYEPASDRGTREDTALDDNGQGAWGIMVRDFVPQISYSGGNVRTTMESWDKNPATLTKINSSVYAVKTSDHRGDSNMILAGGIKRGVRVYWREGIKRNPEVPLTGGDSGNPTASGEQNSSDFRFSYKPREIGDYSIYTNSAGTAPTMAARPDFPKWGTTYRVRLEKTNNGYKYKMTPLDDINTVTGELKPEVNSDQYGMIPLYDITDSVNKEKYYVGLFASRNANVRVSNIKYEEADKEKCAPALPFVPDPLNATLEVVSPGIYGGENYLYVKSNVKGKLTVTQDGKQIPSSLIVDESYDGTDFGSAVPLTLFTVPIFPPKDGDNVFNFIFNPESVYKKTADQGYILSSTAAIRKNFVLAKKVYRNGGYIYASPVGSPNGDGGNARPLDLQTAVNYCQQGQTVILTDGTYILDKTLVISRYNNGRMGAEKILRAENRGKAILDWDKNERRGPDSGDGSIKGQGFLVEGNYWILDGFHVRNTPNKVKGMVIGGKNNVASRLYIYSNGDTGMQISGSSTEPKAFWPSGNRVEFCESFNNRDSADTDADGFAAKLTCGKDNEFWWCVSHNNTDDGWDLFSKKDTGATGAVKIYNSISYLNGYLMNGYEPKAGHNGFKMGGEGIGVSHELHQCLSFLNKGYAVTSNSNPFLLVYNSTAINKDGDGLGGIYIYSGDSAAAAGRTSFSIGSVSIKGRPSTDPDTGDKGTLPSNRGYAGILISGDQLGLPFEEYIEKFDGNSTVSGKKFIERDGNGFFNLKGVYDPGTQDYGAKEFYSSAYVYKYPNPYTRNWP